MNSNLYRDKAIPMRPVFTLKMFMDWMGIVPVLRGIAKPWLLGSLVCNFIFILQMHSLVLSVF